MHGLHVFHLVVPDIAEDVKEVVAGGSAGLL
jgi:hypothetical protein